MGFSDWNTKKRKNMIAMLYMSNLFIGCSIVEHNVNADIFYTWVGKNIIT